MNLYLATTLTNATRAALVAEAFQEAGHRVTFPWWTFMSSDPSAHGLAAISAAEVTGVQGADVVVALLPGGRGTHFEMGLALGKGIPILLHCETGESFKAVPGVCAFHFLRSGLRQNTGDLSNATNLAMLVRCAELAAEQGRAGTFGVSQYGHAAAILDALGGVA